MCMPGMGGIAWAAAERETARSRSAAVIFM
jgi:hypothetical protein